ncbi:integrase domain-containing protein [Photobacterium sp. BZF1]|uniref:integrase domain-containing protein n=1 Tax=Photobacterium sp. BZF1 TaxID=1904457 RepID=UPI001653A65C|nr:integrase domain-containing protein [Photobacterium sp. BZF1]MBC7005526.1 integrase domain-containing protein [Photobacterium sp. BZF1]
MKIPRCREERQNPNARNYGLGSRDIKMAAIKLLEEKRAQQIIGFSTSAFHASRFSIFADWLENTYSIRDMRKICLSHVIEYADHLVERIENPDDKLNSYTTAANYLSSVNSVLSHARGDKLVHFTARDAGYPDRDDILRENKTITHDQHMKAKELVEPRLAAQMGLKRYLGLRFEGSCKINAKQALASAKEHGYVLIDCEKNHTPRKVSIRNAEQIKVLEEAASFQGDHHSLIPADKSYYEYSTYCYRQFSALDGYLPHSERRYFAQTLYTETIFKLTNISGVLCPVVAKIPHGKAHHQYLAEKLNLSLKDAKAIDRQARKIVSLELGHKRISITNSYIG